MDIYKGLGGVSSNFCHSADYRKHWKYVEKKSKEQRDNLYCTHIKRLLSKQGKTALAGTHANKLQGRTAISAIWGDKFSPISFSVAKCCSPWNKFLLICQLCLSLWGNMSMTTQKLKIWRARSIPDVILITMWDQGV